MKTIRATVIGSSGGSALGAAMECWKAAGKRADWLVITDRPCGLLDWGQAQGHVTAQITYHSADQFSRQALTEVMRFGAPDTILFYTRRVAAPLIDSARVFNIHPAWLPQFPGLGAVRQAMQAGAKILGTTLHEVDAGLDTGAVQAQLQVPWVQGWTLEQAERASYLMKVWLTLWWCERLQFGPQAGAPVALRDEAVRSAYEHWCATLASVDPIGTSAGHGPHAGA